MNYTPCIKSTTLLKTDINTIIRLVLLGTVACIFDGAPSLENGKIPSFQPVYWYLRSLLGLLSSVKWMA